MDASTVLDIYRAIALTADVFFSLINKDKEFRVKGGVKIDQWGGGKVDQWRCRRSGIVGEEGVWSGGLRRLKGGAYRPERKTSSSPRRVRRRG